MSKPVKARKYIPPEFINPNPEAVRAEAEATRTPDDTRSERPRGTPVDGFVRVEPRARPAFTERELRNARAVREEAREWPGLQALLSRHIPQAVEPLNKVGKFWVASGMSPTAVACMKAEVAVSMLRDKDFIA